MFMERIATPHLSLEETFSSLSSFTTQYDSNDYEKTMVQNNKIASASRSLLSNLEPFEEQLVMDRGPSPRVRLCIGPQQD